MRRASQHSSTEHTQDRRLNPGHRPLLHETFREGTVPIAGATTPTTNPNTAAGKAVLDSGPLPVSETRDVAPAPATATATPKSAVRLNAFSIPGGIQSVPTLDAPISVKDKAFDWLAYLDYNSDVKEYKFTSQTLVKRHYLWMGEKEQRLFQRIPVVVRYSACGGLMNQHYCHLSGLVIASALGADVAMPVSLSRQSFEQYYSLNPTLNQVTWVSVAQDKVYNIDALEALLAGALRDDSVFNTS